MQPWTRVPRVLAIALGAVVAFAAVTDMPVPVIGQPSENVALAALLANSVFWFLDQMCDRWRFTFIDLVQEGCRIERQLATMPVRPELSRSRQQPQTHVPNHATTSYEPEHLFDGHYTPEHAKNPAATVANAEAVRAALTTSTP